MVSLSLFRVMRCGASSPAATRFSVILKEPFAFVILKEPFAFVILREHFVSCVILSLSKNLIPLSVNSATEGSSSG